MNRVEIGDKVTAKIGFRNEPVEFVVAESCSGKAGRWYCSTCDVTCQNNMEAGRHDRPGHKLGWICPEHGLEVV